MRDLPAGAVTFLFSDIEGSTRLLDELGDRYAELLAEHHRRMRRAFVPRGGVEVDTAGDAFFVAFANPADAVAAAEAAQRALAEIGVRVRMGIHTGQPLLTEAGYVGMDVHRGARIMSAGHGGQVLVSDETRALLDGGDGLRDLGLHRLKDLTEPQRLWQLGDGDFPPLKTLYQTNLPVQPTPLVGREAELAEVLALLRASRLVTLTGAGGSGKTRLALQAAAELVDEYRDGVWWISLAALTDPELVEPTIAQVVGAKEDLAAQLRDKQTLLLLDNFEHLLEAAPLVASLIGEDPDLHVLVTSRERLALAAEHEYAVPTLAPVEAVALFTARAQQLKAGFEPDAGVEKICRRLDGLPLAIELAAARVKVLTPEQILERLGRSLELLTSAARDAPERHQTLRATIEWSYELLGEREEQLFVRLAVFAGSFDLEAAEAVCNAELDTLQSLVDKSLIRQTEDGRFFMLETIREYAGSRLAESQDANGVQARHAEHYAALGDQLARPARHSEPHALDRLQAELDNIRAALSWSLKEKQIDIAERLVGGAWWIWLTKGFAAEGDQWAQAVFDQTSGVSERRASTAALAGEFARHRGDFERALPLKELSVELFEAAGGHPGDIAASYTDLAETLIAVGDLEGGRIAAERGVALRGEHGVDRGIAHAERPLLLVALQTNELDRAEELAAKAVSIYSRREQLSDLADALVLLSAARRRRADFNGAATPLCDALGVLLDVENEAVALDALQEAASHLLAREDVEGARAVLTAAEQRRQASGLVATDPGERDRLLRTLRPQLSNAPSLGLDEALRGALASLELRQLPRR